MPTYGWGDNWGEFGWGGTTSTGDITYAGSVSFSLSASAGSKIKPVIASSVVFINSSTQTVGFVGQSSLSEVFTPSSAKTASFVRSVTAIATFTPSNETTVTPVCDGNTVSFVNSYAKRIKPASAVSVSFTPSSTSRTTVYVSGVISFYVVPSHAKTADFKKAGRQAVYINASSTSRGWRFRDRGQSLFICRTRATSTWKRINRPSTLFVEV